MLVRNRKRLAYGDVGRWLLGSIGLVRHKYGKSFRFRVGIFGRICDRPLPAVWSESFIFAGSSALLLLIANLFSAYWYFSFFALTPFLFRILKAAPIESLRLGFLLGLSFFGALAINTLTVSPLTSAVKLFSGTALFTLFGWSIGWARKRWGFNPCIVALLWIGLETGLMKLGFVGGVLAEGGLSHPFFGSLIGLFGCLAVSAIVVLFNSLLALAIAETIEVTRPRKKPASEDEREWKLSFTRNLFADKVYFVPEGRAPPRIPDCVIIRVRL